MATSYDLYKKAKQRELQAARDNTINSYNAEKGDVENTYKTLADTLAKRKNDLALSNTNNLKTLNTQLQTGDQGYLTQRDQGVIANKTAENNIKNWYANHNIANSTASADELGRQATTLANTLGTVNQSKNTFDTGIANDIDTTNQTFQNNLNDVENQDLAGQREKAQNVAKILAEIQNANNSYNANLQSAYDTIDAQRMANEEAAAKAAATAAKKAAKGNKTKDKQSMYDGIEQYGKNGTASGFIETNKQAIIDNLGEDAYNTMKNKAIKADYAYNATYAGQAKRASYISQLMRNKKSLNMDRGF